MGIGHDVLLQQFKTYGKSQTMITKTIEKNKEEKPVKQNHELLVASFFYDNFLEKMNIHSSKVQDLTTLVKDLARATSDEYIVGILDNTITADQKEAILESQLYRERQREIHNEEKKEREVQDLCRVYIQRAMQHLNKLSRIPAAEKQALHEKMRKVLMGK